jgi:hypothetical protein
MYASPPVEVPPMMRNTIGNSKMMITVFHGGEVSICVDALNLNEPFPQSHFINFVLPDLKEHAQKLRK